MKKWNQRSKKNSYSKAFKPSRIEIEDAVNEFLKNGGSIKKIEANESNFKDFVALNELPSAADDFLNGQ